MDLSGYGDFATSMYIRGAFPLFSVIVLTWGKEKEEHTSEMVREYAILNWSGAFGAPEITTTGRDARFTGAVFLGFRTDRNNSASGNSGPSSKFWSDGSQARFASNDY